MHKEGLANSKSYKMETKMLNAQLVGDIDHKIGNYNRSMMMMKVVPRFKCQSCYYLAAA